MNSNTKFISMITLVMLIITIVATFGCRAQSRANSFGNIPETLSSDYITSSISDQSSSNTSPVPNPDLSKRPIDENGNPFSFYLDEKKQPHYFQLPKDYQLCHITDKSDYMLILECISELNRLERIEQPQYRNGDIFDLSVHTLFYAAEKAKLASTQNTQCWNNSYLSTNNYAGPGWAYLSKSSMDKFINDLYCSDSQNISLDKLQYYYCNPVKHYVVPYMDQYASDLPVLRNISQDDDQIRIEFSFLYYVYYDIPEDEENKIVDINGNVIGQFIKGETVLNHSKLSQMESFKFTFCKDGENLKIHSVEYIKE